MKTTPREIEIFGAAKAAGTAASFAPDTGKLTVCCPRCRADRGDGSQIMDVSESGAICPVCDLKAVGNAEQVTAALKITYTPTDAEVDSLPLWTLDDLLSHKVDPANQIWVGGILTTGDAAGIIGAPGIGKTRISLQAAICTILGRPFLGWETRGKGKKWLFLQTENNGDRLKYDLQRMTAPLSQDDRKLIHDSLRIVKIEAMDFGSICMVEGHPDRSRIVRTIEVWNPDIVVIDPLRDAGKGDPNKDEMMMETCQAIAEVVKYNAPKRVPLIIHHGRTGKAEASRVFGDDSGSFARNSKVLYGWLRSQINVAEAGIDYPGVVIFGCGKCSNGRKWAPFAARLDEPTMQYTRLSKEEFDLDEWAGEAGAGKAWAGKSKRKISPEEVAAVISKHGGRLRGGEKAAEGLVQNLRREYKLSRDDALHAVDGALGVTVEYADEPNPKGQPARVYYLKSVRPVCPSVPRGTPGT